VRAPNRKELLALDGYRRQARTGSRFVASWSVLLQELLRCGWVGGIVRSNAAGAARESVHGHITREGLAALHREDMRKLKSAQQLVMFGGAK